MTDLFSGRCRLNDLPREYHEPWVIESFWTRSGFNMMVGAPKARKSYFRRYLMACAMSGTSALGQFKCHDTVKRALICFGEGPVKAEGALLHRACENLGVEDAGARIEIVKPFGFHLDSRNGVQELLDLIDGEGFDLVVIDPLLYFHSQEENDARGMGLVCAGLIRLSEKACIVVVHHTAKAQAGMPERPVTHEGRGSSTLGGAADTYLKFERVGQTNTHRLRFATRGAKEPENLSITYDDASGLFFSGDFTMDKTIIETVSLNPGISPSKLAQVLGRRKDTILERVKTLAGTHLSMIADEGKAHGNMLFAVSERSSPILGTTGTTSQ